MNLITLVLTAFGLSIDAFAASVTNGIVIHNLKIKHAVKIALYFGFFQAVMPLIGWSVGINFSTYIVEIDHWVAFFVLGYIGIKMVAESFKKEEENEVPSKEENPINDKTLFMLAVATSIDALAVGISFSFLNVAILQSAIVIGVITFIISFAGVIFGKKCGILFKKRAKALGGIILALMGFKILMEHTGMLSFL
ncbi:putative manganese efflux pump MntP [Oxobacter pfennigii]|uniref:Putative manganese efflux pump MntP n=1 Tax=Oxobacter pfennigii TaxID=36849 RepID=A0A0P8YD15_9CLOT|nr:manganese efflux pump MntP family protein [Oxobacter pfennigii]KPU45108.1 putative manganese efflux pump MntP [Oxobacter pfennigii]